MDGLNSFVKQNPAISVGAATIVGFVVGTIASKGLTAETITLFAAALAAFIGFSAYAWQKRVERREQVLSECRSVYLEYIKAAEMLLKVHCSDCSAGDKDKATGIYRDAYHALSIYGTDAMIEQAKPYLLEVVRFTDDRFVEPDQDPQVVAIRKRIDGIRSLMRDDCHDASIRVVD